MSLFSSLAKNLLSWGLATAKTEAQTVGLKAVQDAMTQLNNAAQAHAPDVAPAVADLGQQIVSTLVAGITTRSK